MSISKAIDNQDLSALKDAIKNGGDVNKIIFKPFKFTPLHVAVKSGNLEIVKELLKSGAQINAADSLGNISLHIAAKYSTPEMNDVLLKSGADVNAKNKHREIPLHVIGKDNENIVPIAATHLTQLGSYG